MKIVKFLFIVMLGIFILPFAVFAEGEETTQSSEETGKVNIYLFRGEGCSHCAEAEEWFDSIQEEYGQYYNIVDYETWYDEENAELMNRVAEARKEEVAGVPYIIIGNKSWNGFSDDYKEAMLAEIVAEYDKSADERYDIMELLDTISSDEEESYAADFLVLLLILAVVGGITGAIIYARKRTA